MNSEREKHLGPWIVALLIGLPVVYVASFGPACWLCERGILGQRNAWVAYRPIGWTWSNGPRAVRRAIAGYCGLFGDERRIRFGLGPHLDANSKSPLDYEICNSFWNWSSK
jgi:hypothetical protein